MGNDVLMKHRFHGLSEKNGEMLAYVKIYEYICENLGKACLSTYNDA